jgi:hypothetical protein
MSHLFSRSRHAHVIGRGSSVLLHTRVLGGARKFEKKEVIGYFQSGFASPRKHIVIGNLSKWMALHGVDRNDCVGIN